MLSPRYYPREASLLMSLTSLLHHKLVAGEGAGIKVVPLDQGSYSSYPLGYTHLHSALSHFYGTLLLQEDAEAHAQAPFSQQGYVLGRVPADSPMVARWDQIIRSHGDQRSLQTEMLEDPALLDQFTADWVELVNSDAFVALTGSKLLIHNGFTDVLVPSENRLSVSGKWHYDNYTPGPYVRYLFFLNDFEEHGGGIDLFDRGWSHRFSDSSGYVGLPLDHRLSDLEPLCRVHGFDYQPVEVRPSAGDFLCFSSSRCIHRGMNPTRGPRHVVFLCGIPVSPTVPTELVVRYSRALLQNQNPGSDLIPVFRCDPPAAPPLPDQQQALRLDQPAFSHPHLADELCRELGLASESAHARLIRLFCDRPRPAASQLQLLQLVLTDLQLAASIDAALQPLLQRFQGYLVSLNKEIQRYQPNEQRLREHIYWPNPTHEKYGRTLADEKPYVRPEPLIDASTPLATAGSCFAYEIARVFQERGYNYVVTEKPDPAQGIYASDYEPDDPYVPFSANFGILFNTPSLHQLAQRAFGERQFQRLLMKRGEVFHDPYRETVFFASPEAHALDYDRHTSALQRMLTEARVFIFTLGLNECWRLRSDGTALSRNPDADLMPYVRHQRLSVADNVAALSGFYELVKRYNPEFQLILSLSPIPFLATGLADQEHVIAANCHSKSTLRVAAQEMADRYADVHYFPSYELIHYCESDPWEPDLRHVRRDTVSRVVSLFEEIYVRR
jgi:hypothetical protein